MDFGLSFKRRAETRDNIFFLGFTLEIPFIRRVKSGPELLDKFILEIDRVI
jgi:hypothetical protein